VKFLKNVTTVASFFFALLILVHFSVIFGFITFLVSILVLGRVEYERNAHEVSFYITNEPPRFFKFYCRCYGIVAAVGRSLILGVMSIFLFSGTEFERIFSLAFLFAVCVVLGYVGLRFIQRRAYIDVTRWGYVHFSLLLGVLFSIHCSWVRGIGSATIAWQAAKSGVGGSLSFDELAELLYGIMYQVNTFLSKTLHAILGDTLGGLMSLAISVNVIYGFVIVVYSLFLYRLVSSQVPPKVTSPGN
jgi:hypothetical protein